MFLASVAEEAIQFGFGLSDIIAFILIKKLFQLICYLKDCLQNKKNTFDLVMWDQYVNSKDFFKIGEFIFKEYDLFHTYYKNLNQNVTDKFLGKEHKYGKIIERLIYTKSSKELDDILKFLMKDYFNGIFVDSQIYQYNRTRKEVWIHINQLLDCLNSEKVFYFDQTGQKQFNFKLFYQEIKTLGLNENEKLVLEKLRNEGVQISY